MGKPDTATAMRNMLEKIRHTIPFDAPESSTCSDSESCQGCSVKLLEYLQLEVDNWQQKLDEGYRPNFADLSALEKSARKIYRSLERNDLV